MNKSQLRNLEIILEKKKFKNLNLVFAMNFFFLFLGKKKIKN